MRNIWWLASTLSMLTLSGCCGMMKSGGLGCWGGRGGLGCGPCYAPCDPYATCAYVPAPAMSPPQSCLVQPTGCQQPVSPPATNCGCQTPPAVPPAQPQSPPPPPTLYEEPPRPVSPPAPAAIPQPATPAQPLPSPGAPPRTPLPFDDESVPPQPGTDHADPRVSWRATQSSGAPKMASERQRASTLAVPRSSDTPSHASIRQPPQPTAPVQASSTNWQPTSPRLPQIVSWEEFQRLPGQVISREEVPLNSSLATPTPATTTTARPLVVPMSTSTAQPQSVVPPSASPAPTQVVIQPAEWAAPLPAGAPQ
ncbi:MAG: hypothetical protein KatS3mg114_0688 [Planctomycetaceae bacterium]|nr:MAG: hypothetical protein KatS3mg114_0688 [Planctomycetaceae bacterium]